jgi:hypothetical protein
MASYIIYILQRFNSRKFVAVVSLNFVMGTINLKLVKLVQDRERQLARY